MVDIYTPKKALFRLKLVKLNDGCSQMLELISLAPHLPASLLSEALEIVKGMEIDEYKAGASIGLAPYLPANLLSEVWAIVRGIQDKDKRISVSIDLLAHISEISPIEAVEILRGIQE
jgi:hypothetical protein